MDEEHIQSANVDYFELSGCESTNKVDRKIYLQEDEEEVDKATGDEYDDVEGAGDEDVVDHDNKAKHDEVFDEELNIT